MSNKLILLSLDGVNEIDEKDFESKYIDIVFVYSLSDLGRYIRKENPDAILIQSKKISLEILSRLNQIFETYNYYLPWLCLVLKNSKESEKNARINKVFYYGVGEESVAMVTLAAQDAILHGVEQKKKYSLIPN